MVTSFARAKNIGSRHDRMLERLGTVEQVVLGLSVAAAAIVLGLGIHSIFGWG